MFIFKFNALLSIYDSGSPGMRGTKTSVFIKPTKMKDAGCVIDAGKYRLSDRPEKAKAIWWPSSTRSTIVFTVDKYVGITDPHGFPEHTFKGYFETYHHSDILIGYHCPVCQKSKGLRGSFLQEVTLYTGIDGEHTMCLPEDIPGSLPFLCCPACEFQGPTRLFNRELMTQRKTK